MDSLAIVSKPSSETEKTLIDLLEQVFHFHLTSIDMMAPNITAMKTMAAQSIFEAERPLPASPMYCTPWKELACVYSRAVSFADSFESMD